MVDRFPPRHGEYHDIDEDDGAVRDCDPMLTEGDAPMLSGMLFVRCDAGKRYRAASKDGETRITTPHVVMPAVSLIVRNEDVPQLIADLKNAIGDTDDSELPVDRMGSGVRGGRDVDLSDPGEHLERGGAGS